MQMEMRLKYNVSTIDGKVYGVYNERHSGSQITSYFGPFNSKEEAEDDCKKYKEAWGYGYSGSAEPVFVNEQWYSYQKRWNSCD